MPVFKYKFETLYPGTIVSTLSVSSEALSRNYNQQQNELRHLAFLCFTDFKRRKYCFSSPIPSMQCCADVRATYRKQGKGCGFFCSPKLHYVSTMSQQFCH